MDGLGAGLTGMGPFNCMHVLGPGGGCLSVTGARKVLGLDDGILRLQHLQYIPAAGGRHDHLEPHLGALYGQLALQPGQDLHSGTWSDRCSTTNEHQAGRAYGEAQCSGMLVHGRLFWQGGLHVQRQRLEVQQPSSHVREGACLQSLLLCIALGIHGDMQILHGALQHGDRERSTRLRINALFCQDAGNITEQVLILNFSFLV